MGLPNMFSSFEDRWLCNHLFCIKSKYERKRVWTASDQTLSEPGSGGTCLVCSRIHVLRIHRLCFLPWRYSSLSDFYVPCLRPGRCSKFEKQPSGCNVFSHIIKILEKHFNTWTANSNEHVSFSLPRLKWLTGKTASPTNSAMYRPSAFSDTEYTSCSRDEIYIPNT